MLKQSLNGTPAYIQKRSSTLYQERIIYQLSLPTGTVGGGDWGLL